MLQPGCEAIHSAGVRSPHGIRRVIIVVLDGLRADAAHLFPLPNIAALSDEGTHTFCARTVTPSVTAAAMTSLLTGVTPGVHGLTSDRFAMPRPRLPLTPLPRALYEAGLPSSVFLARLPRAFRGLAERITKALAVDYASFRGESAHEILDAAADSLTVQREGLILLHWPDADRAGHAHGWNSTEYAAAARRLDSALARLVAATRVMHDPETVLIVCADHGGGGVFAKAHDSQHPQDQRIPLLLLGARVMRGCLPPGCSLLDVPATTCWLLGVDIPETYSGFPLVQALVIPNEPIPRVATVA